MDWPVMCRISSLPWNVLHQKIPHTCKQYHLAYVATTTCTTIKIWFNCKYSSSCKAVVWQWLILASMVNGIILEYWLTTCYCTVLLTLWKNPTASTQMPYNWSLTKTENPDVCIASQTKKVYEPKRQSTMYVYSTFTIMATWTNEHFSN